MKFALIVCTYLRPKSLYKLLVSVKSQTLYPDEIIIVDGSNNDETKLVLKQNHFDNLTYFKVDASQKGLTKQRNYGTSKVSKTMDVVCFLDDDTLLHPDYFKEILHTYQAYPKALGVGGYITNEVLWRPSDGSQSNTSFYYDGWMRDEPLRFRARRLFGLQPDTPPCYLPTFSHGRSVSFLPPSGKVYPVEQFMGGVASYRRRVFDSLKFSSYFEGYGLYEDTDFCLRLAKQGKLYVNTKAQVEHHHEASGRPNNYQYGKMVVKNGWYVWKVKYPQPSLKARLKWHLTTILLLKLTFLGVFMSGHKKASLTEGIGRLVGWCSVLFNPPNPDL